MDQTVECLRKEIQSIEKRQEEDIEQSHRYDSLTLLLYMLLLILSVLTSWLFKHRRLRYVHETGLSIIYGLIAGIIIRYATPLKSYHSARLNLSAHPNDSCKDIRPPQRVFLYLPVSIPNAHSLVPNVTVTTPSPISEVEKLIYSYALLHQIKDDELALNRELQEKVTFNSEIFFNILLPPIIFSAGYSMKRKHFFRNFGAITTYAFLGTLISSSVVGIICYLSSLMFPSLKAILSLSDCLLFGAMISATDPVTVLAIFNDLAVDVTLYALVFGESVLNDAVAIVLAQSVEEYGDLSDGKLSGYAVLTAVKNFAVVFCGALAIGVFTGCVTALLTKFTHIRDHPLLETALFTLMSYSTFLLSEAVGFTGIVAVLFCGVTQAHYTFNNLSEESQIWTKEFFELLNFLAENFVFTYIGVSVFTFQQHNWHVGFIICAILACIVGRALHVYPLSFLLNLGRSDTITLNKQHMIMWSGLRGAMAFSLAIRNVSSPARQLFLTTTLVIVMITIIFCGGMVTPMLQLLKVKIGALESLHYSGAAVPRIPSSSSRRSYMPLPVGQTQEYRRRQSVEMDENITVASNSSLPTNEAQTTMQRGKSSVARMWGNFDNKLLKPILTHSGPLLSETLPKCCLGCAELLTTDEQLIRCTTNAPPPRNVTAISRAAAVLSQAGDGLEEGGDFRYHKSRLDYDEFNDSSFDDANGQIVFRSEYLEQDTNVATDAQNSTSGRSLEGDAQESQGIINPLFHA